MKGWKKKRFAIQDTKNNQPHQKILISFNKFYKKELIGPNAEYRIFDSTTKRQ